MHSLEIVCYSFQTTKIRPSGQVELRLHNVTKLNTDDMFANLALTWGEAHVTNFKELDLDAKISL